VSFKIGDVEPDGQYTFFPKIGRSLYSQEPSSYFLQDYMTPTVFSNVDLFHRTSSKNIENIENE
jgi:hypothetical protein